MIITATIKENIVVNNIYNKITYRNNIIINDSA